MSHAYNVQTKKDKVGSAKFNEVTEALGRINDLGLYGELPAQYVIFKVGNNYYARNGTTGKIAFSGSAASTVIQASIDALGIDGGRIYLKQGVYELASYLELHDGQAKGSNLIIQGSGSKTILRYTGTPTAAHGLLCLGHNFTILSDPNAYVDKFVLKDLVLDGNNKIQVALLATAIHSSLISNVEVIKIKVVGDYALGIALTETDGKVTIENCRIHDIHRVSDSFPVFGIWTTGSSHLGAIIKDNYLWDITSDVAGGGAAIGIGEDHAINDVVMGNVLTLSDDNLYGIQAYPEEEQRILNNRIYYGRIGIRLETADAAPTPRMILSKNRITSPYLYGIYAPRLQHSIIEGNIIQNVRGAADIIGGITVGATPITYSSENVIVNNIVDYARYGIMLDYSVNHVIKNNILLNCSVGAIYFGSGLSGNIIKDNYGYNPVGVIANPYPAATGNLRNVSAAQAYPTSDAVYTVVETPKTVIVGGGTISAIAINGVTTGLTSGVFHLDIGETIKVTHSVNPTINQVRAE